MRRIARSTSCLLLVSLVLVGLGETESLVLCIGDDGHISFEDARTGICGHTLAKVAGELGLPIRHYKVRQRAKCCPCSDMDLPGHSLDYPEVQPPIVFYTPEPADISAPVLAQVFTEIEYVPSGEIIPHPPPPDAGGNVVRVVLRSVVILA